MLLKILAFFGLHTMAATLGFLNCVPSQKKYFLQPWWVPWLLSAAACFQSSFWGRATQPGKAKKKQRLFCPISRSKFTDSEVTDNTSLPCSARWKEVSGDNSVIYAWPGLLWKCFMIVSCMWWVHWVWLCVTEAACLWCCCQSSSPDSQCKVQ